MATNLEFIKETQVASAVTSFDFDNIFSNKYDVYEIHLENFTYPTSATWLNLRFLDSTGSVISTANYDWALNNSYSAGGTNEYRGTNSTGITYGGQYTSSSTQGNAELITVYNPFDSASYTFINNKGSQFATNLYSNRKIGVLKIAGSHRGINLYTGNATTFDNGKIKVFGVK